MTDDAEKLAMLRVESSRVNNLCESLLRERNQAMESKEAYGSSLFGYGLTLGIFMTLAAMAVVQVFT